MVERSAAIAARAMEGAVIAGDPAGVWSGAAIDSRRVAGREIFFALPGEKADGHDFVARALEQGAAAVVIHRDLETPGPGEGQAAWVRVSDTYRALHALTRSVRADVPERLVAITGSAGKTTTKELLAAMLGRRFRTERSPGNLNNLYGFPLSLLNIRDDCEWMVAEMGMSSPGELRQVSLLGRPDVAVFTNVRPAHLENFRHLRDIADAKAELLAGLADGGLIVANADDPEVMYIVERHRAERGDATRGEAQARYVLYGMETDSGEQPSATVTATVPEVLSGDKPGSRFVLTAAGESVDVELPIHGLYNVENCLAAAACAHALGVSLPEIAAAVAGLAPGRMRGEVHRRGGLTVIDDSYNSNPDAAQRALESARQLPARRYVAVLGDMLELGPEAPSFHRAVGDQAADLGFALLVGVGELTRELVAAANQRGLETRWFADSSEAARWAASAPGGPEAAAALVPEDLGPADLAPGDLVLVKGSRGVGLEVVVDQLLSALSGKGREG